MRWLINASLRSKGLVVALGIGMVVVGIAQLNSMPRDVLPEFRPPTVEVQTEALGLSAEEVEQLITTPLEQDLLNGVAFLDFIRSESLPGLSRIEMVFEPGTEIARARQVVNERLTQAHALPNVSRPPQMLQPLSSTSRLMMVGLTSEKKSLIDLGLLARWTVRPRLMSVPGVANVAIWGQREHQVQVRVDPERLRGAGVSLEQIIQTAGNSLWSSPLTFLEASTPGAGGFFDTSTQRIGVEHTQPIKTADDLAKVAVEGSVTGTNGSTTVTRLGDVADLVEDHQPLIGDAILSSGPGLVIVVEKLPGANTVEVTRDLDKALDALRPGMSGITVEASFFRPADYVESANDNLRTGLVIGGVLLAIALGALLFGLRSLFVSLVAVGLSLAGAIAILAFRGETLNAMILAGLVLALVVLVDDAVVGTSALRGAESDDNAAAALIAVRGPLGYATILMLLPLIPILVLDGESGAFLPPLAVSYAWAVVASLIVAMTVTPALDRLLRSKSETPDRQSPVFRWLHPVYEKALAPFLRASRTGVVVALALLLVGVFLFPVVDRSDSVIPEFKDRDVLVKLKSAPGTSLPEMTRLTASAGESLRALPGVDDVGGHVGRAVLGDQTVNVDSSELWVSIDNDVDYDSAVQAIDDDVVGLDGVEATVLTYPRERINSVLKTPDGVRGKDLTVRVFGFNADTVRSTAEEVVAGINSVDGVDAPEIQAVESQPTVQVEVDLDAAQALGVNPGEVRRTAATVLAGIEVGSLFHEQKIFEVVVWGSPETRDGVETLRRLPIALPDGESQVALDEIADVTMVDAPNVIRHEDASRYLDIGLDVNGRDLSDVAADVQDRLRDMKLPLEYHAEVVREYESTDSSRVTFIGTTIAVLLASFLVLQAALGSWRLGFALFVALPGALTGGVLATLIAGDALSAGSLLGFFGVFAFAARGSVLLARRAQYLEDHDGERLGPDLLRRVATERLAPTVTSAVATVVLLVPLLFSADRAGFEVANPMAVVLVGGLITAVAFILLVVPALYLAFGSRPADRESLDDLVGMPPEDEAPAEYDDDRSPSDV